MKRSDYDPSSKLGPIAILITFVIILGMAVGYNSCMYGDWTCAFKRCVSVKR